MYFYKIIDEFPRLICAKKTVAPIIIKRHHGMGLFSFINLKKRKRITLLVVDLDKIIKGAGKKLAQFTWISSLLRLMRFPVYSWNLQRICISKCGLLGRIFTFVWNNSFPEAAPHKCVDSLQPIFFAGNSLFFLAIHKVCQRKTAFFQRKISGWLLAANLCGAARNEKRPLHPINEWWTQGPQGWSIWSA